MDAFSKLTLDDHENEHENLSGILNLSISDGTVNVQDRSQLLQEAITGYLPHFPSNPSPLRNNMDLSSVAFEPHHTGLDVDMIVSSEPDIDMASITSDDDVELEVQEVVQDEEDNDDAREVVCNAVPKDTVNSSAIVKAFLSPTQLGVAVATARTDCDDITSFNENQPEIEILKNDLRSRSHNDQPIHVSINNNNHNYYYNHNHNHNHNDTLRNEVSEDHTLRRPWSTDYKLPRPWATDSTPTSRFSYNIVSYFQVLLNSMTATLIVLYIFKIFKSDLNSLWYQNKNVMINESLACQRQYHINKCHENHRLPALTQDCERWLHCMHRDNEKSFSDRSLLMMNLLGRMLESFVEPIGWKTVLVLLLTLITWLFSTNFLLGFLRAKSYYGQNIALPALGKRTPDFELDRIATTDLDGQLGYYIKGPLEVDDSKLSNHREKGTL